MSTQAKFRMFRINLGPRSQAETKSIEEFMRGHQKDIKEHQRGTLYNTKWSIRVTRPSEGDPGVVLVSLHCGRKRESTIEALARHAFAGSVDVGPLHDVYDYPLPKSQYAYAADDRDLEPTDEPDEQEVTGTATRQLKLLKLRLNDSLKRTQTLQGEVNKLYSRKEQYKQLYKDEAYMVERERARDNAASHASNILTAIVAATPDPAMVDSVKQHSECILMGEEDVQQCNTRSHPDFEEYKKHHPGIYQAVVASEGREINLHKDSYEHYKGVRHHRGDSYTSRATFYESQLARDRKLASGNIIQQGKYALPWFLATPGTPK